MRIMTRYMMAYEFKKYAQDDYCCYIACKDEREFTAIAKAFGSLGLKSWAYVKDLTNERQVVNLWYNDTHHEKNYKGYAYILFFIHGFERGDTNVIFYHTNPLIDKASHDFHKPCGFKTAINIIKKFKKLEKYINVDL